MAENIFPTAGRKYDTYISQGASGNSLFPTQNIDLYASIYGNIKYKSDKDRSAKYCSYHTTSQFGSILDQIPVMIVDPS